MAQKVHPYSIISDFDVNLFDSGKHTKMFDKLGSHITEVNGESGVYFAVYAPAALQVQVIGDFNYWNGYEHNLNVRWDGSGIWEGFIPGVGLGALYKYRIYSNHDSAIREKADPYARLYENPPKTASVVWHDDYKWQDEEWMATREEKAGLDSAMTIYELHLGSWKKTADGSRSLHYTELAEQLVDYVQEMGYTHVELMPVMEHPYFPSWGYLCTGYFAPSSRYGSPAELKYLIDKLHQAGVGVLLDWVPAHFPADEHALADFDGSSLYEHPDPQRGHHPDWNSSIFNYERPQIRSFLLSSAHFWCQYFHADGIRVDAVASMLYLDYSRKDGEWSPNIYGGNENLASIELLKELNVSIYGDFPGVHMIAEESTAFPGVTRPVHLGGLGFGLKWMMGWMNDTLAYFEKDPIHRKYHHHEMSRSLTYAFSENYVLPLSHDEVVHGKQALVTKMPGDEWQRFANLRLLYLAMYTHPGQKLLFMGCDIGQTAEWDVNQSIPWHLLDHAPHKGVQQMVKAINKLYRSETALYGTNYSHDGYEWIDYGDSENTVLSYIRRHESQYVVVVLNFSPVVREAYAVGVPEAGSYEVLFNSDDEQYWGSGVANGVATAAGHGMHGREQSISLRLPPLGGLVLKKTTK